MSWAAQDGGDGAGQEASGCTVTAALGTNEQAPLATTQPVPAASTAQVAPAASTSSPQVASTVGALMQTLASAAQAAFIAELLAHGDQLSPDAKPSPAARSV